MKEEFKTCECECDFCAGTCDLPEGHHDEEEFNLSSKIDNSIRPLRMGLLRTEHVKEFIKKDWELIVAYKKEQITFEELMNKRDKLVGINYQNDIFC